MGKMWKAAEAYNCRGFPGQINIQEGENVEVLEPDADGYTQVRNSKGDKGRVPTEGLGIVKDHLITKMNYLVEPGEKIGKKWKAAEAYNCHGVRGHIIMHQGETVEALEQPDDNSLIKVKTNKGDVGFVPRDCLGIVRKDLINHS